MKDPQGRYWKADVNYASVARQEAYQRDQDEKERAKQDRAIAASHARKEKLIRALQMFPDGTTKKSIQDVTGLNGVVINDITSEMLFRDELEVVEIEKNGRKLSALKLKNIDRVQPCLGVSGHGQTRLGDDGGTDRVWGGTLSPVGGESPVDTVRPSPLGPSDTPAGLPLTGTNSRHGRKDPWAVTNETEF